MTYFQHVSDTEFHFIYLSYNRHNPQASKCLSWDFGLKVKFSQQQKMNSKREAPVIFLCIFLKSLSSSLGAHDYGLM